MVGCYDIFMLTVLLCFLLLVYMHTFRGLYYSSYLYPKEALWVVGVVILLLMILTAFMGLRITVGSNVFLGCLL